MENIYLNRNFKNSEDETIVGNVVAIIETLEKEIEKINNNKLNNFISLKIKEIMYSILVLIEDKDNEKSKGE